MRESCTLVIFGSTGNLAQVKLLPALYHLELAGHLPPAMRVLGFGRRDWSDDQWRGQVRELLTARVSGGGARGLDDVALERLLARLRFVQGDLDDDV
jgi:glucose-6-phosphate 1-dehydrogenase